MTPRDRRRLVLLGLPSLALALGVTMVSSLLPVLLHEVSGSALPTALLALEGLFALFLPSALGAWSDRTQSRLGPRLPFIVASAPLIVIALALMPTAKSVGIAALLLVVFYAGYSGYFVAQFALYLDLVEPAQRGRSQGAMNALREVGLGLALVAGPALLAVGNWVPFEAAALVVAAISVGFVWSLVRFVPEAKENPPRRDDGPSPWKTLADGWALVRANARVRSVVAANALWETALNALRAFVVLYLTAGIGRSGAAASLVMLVVVASVLVASPLSGWLADRVGEVRVMQTAAVVYAGGAWVPGFFHETWVVVIVLPVAFAAGVLMTLPFALLMRVLPEERQEDEQRGGRGAGVFAISRGAGLILGPVLGAVAVTTLEPLFASSNGFGAIFPLAALAIAASIPLLRALPAPERDQ